MKRLISSVQKTAENRRYELSKGTGLANGLTPKEEEYATLLATGMAQCDAYDEIWPSSTRDRHSTYVSAHRKAVKVKPRVEAIIAAAGRRAEISLAKLTEMVLEDRQDAKSDKQHASAIAADKLLADMYGHSKSAVRADDLMKGIIGLLAGLDRAQTARDITTIDAEAVEIDDE